MDPSLLDYLQKGNFVFHEIVPTLQEIASLNLAVALSSDIIDRETFRNEDADLDEMLYSNFKIIPDEAKNLLQQWNIPQTIQDFINHWCSKVAYRLNNFTCYINLELFHGNFLRFSDFKYLVWKSNGKIDYEMSARRMLTDPDIKQTDVFIIMCEFCWKDEIEGLVPGVELEQFMNEIIDDENGFYDFPLTYYWICKLKDELHRIPFDAELNSLEYFMLSRYARHLSSIEYFWNFLTEPDQISITIKLLNSNFMAAKQTWLLAKLNEFQRFSVIAEIPHAIIKNFLKRSNFEAARLLWNRLENFINDDQFSTLLKNIVENVFNEKSCFFMAELWDLACDHYKNHFVYTRRDLIVELYFSPSYGASRDGRLPFLFTILSYASSEYRRNIILQHGDVLIVGYWNCAEVNKIVELCLPNPDDIALFNALLYASPEMESYYRRFIYEEGNFEILVTRLESRVRYQSIVIHHIRRVLEYDIPFQSDRLGFFESWPHVKKLLKIVYGTDLLNIVKIKNKLIFSLEQNHHDEEDYPPSAVNLRHYRDALQDLIDDTDALDEESKMEI